MMKRLHAFTVALVLAAPACWAAPVTGTWQGTWDQGGGGGEVTMTITDQTADGAGDIISGHFDWSCTTNVVCSGREIFSGSLIANTLDVTGNSLVNPINLELGRYVGTLSGDGLSIAGDMFIAGTGTGAPLGTWTVSRVSEPGAVALLGLGLAGIAFARRRKQ